MAPRATKKDKTAAPVTKTNNSIEGPPPAVTSPEVPAATAVVVKDKSEIIRANFLEVKNLIQADVTKISAYKVVTSPQEAEGLNAAMRSLNEKKKLVEKIHKTGKAPAWEECKMWDDAKKELCDITVETALQEAKGMLTVWDLKQREAEAERQRVADLERKRLDGLAQAEAQRISNIKVELDTFEQAIAKKIIEAPTNPALYEIWTKDLAPFVPSEQTHGAFAQHANEMKSRLERLGKACSAKIQATDQFNAGRIALSTRNEIHELNDNIIREYSFVRDQAMQQVAIMETAAVEEATVATEIQKSQITGQQMAQQATPMLNYRRQWRWEVADKAAIGSSVKIMQPLQQLYIQIDGKYVPAYVQPSFTELFTLDTEKIKGFIESTNASDNPLANGEVVDGIAFYLEETAVMPRS